MLYLPHFNSRDFKLNYISYITSLYIMFHTSIWKYKPFFSQILNTCEKNVNELI